MANLMELSPEEISLKARRGELAVVVVGLGWMGLPTACLYAKAGARVIGVDKNRKVVEAVNAGACPVEEPELPRLLKEAVEAGRLRATARFNEAVPEGDAILVVVPTTVTPAKKSDYSALTQACREIGRNLRPGSCVIVESTCEPGTTEGLVKQTLERFSGLKAGVDFALAHSPIRAKAGTSVKDLQTYVRIVGGLNEKSAEAAGAVKSLIAKGGVLKVSDARTAEAVKLFEAVYRDVNIALANELAALCEKMGVDYVEAMEAANTQPYSHLHVPGVGVGGHCLPVYPYLLASRAEEAGVKLKLIKLARKINESMPRHALRLAAEALRECGKTFRRAKIAVLGLAYRANVKETRGSPALELAKLAEKRGARVTVFDPKYTLSEVEAMGLRSKPTLGMVLERADCAIITVAHEEFKALRPGDLCAKMARPAALVDCAHVLDPREVEEAGLVYRGVGRGVWSR